MAERVFGRGSSCISLKQAIRLRLNLPSNYHDTDSPKPPGLAFSELTYNDLANREAYARDDARSVNQLPCVVILHITKSNFPHLKGKIFNTIQLPRDVTVRFRYVPVIEYENIHSLGEIAIAMIGLSKKDLIALNAEIGLERNMGSGFDYKTYESNVK